MENQKIKLKFLSPVILQENSDKLIIFNGEKVIKKLTGYIQYPKEYESVSNFLNFIAFINTGSRAYLSTLF